MKKYYFTIASLLVLGLASCSNEETKTQNQVASRPTIPIMVNEVQIGNQIWMTKNLNVSHYRNGDPIPQVTDGTQWSNLTTGAWCYYNNDPANGPKYGKLYNWYAVNDPRGLSPWGWYIPVDAEWSALINFLGGADVAGHKLISVSGWNSPYPFVTNSSGFTALPGGIRNPYGGLFNSAGDYGYWWSSSPYAGTDATFRYMGNGGISGYYMKKSFGISVRCIRY